jgi:hypothetical protein
VNVGVLLLDLALSRGQRVNASGRALLLAAHGCLVSLWRRRLRAGWNLLVDWRSHVGARLSSLSGKPFGVMGSGG